MQVQAQTSMRPVSGAAATTGDGDSRCDSPSLSRLRSTGSPAMPPLPPLPPLVLPTLLPLRPCQL